MTTPPSHSGPFTSFLLTRLYPVAVILLIASIIAFGTVLASTMVPVGIVTALAPTSDTLVRLAEPALLATLLGITLHSGLTEMEQKSPRRVAVWHLTAHLTTLGLVAAALVVQARVGHLWPWPLLVGLLGYHGIALLGSALLGSFGPTLSALFALAVVVVGVNGANEPAWWAWPLAPDIATQATAAATLWVAGIAAQVIQHGRVRRRRRHRG
ncbi:hypothetical protein GCM10027053_23080 [Intrasporangium mesophilum]